MEYRTFTTIEAGLRALANAQAYVYETGTTTQASIFDEDGNALSQPILSDNEGTFAFAAADGVYDVSVTYLGATKVTENVSFADPTSITASASAAAASASTALTAQSDAEAARDAAQAALAAMDAASLDGNDTITATWDLTGATLSMPTSVTEQADLPFINVANYDDGTIGPLVATSSDATTRTNNSTRLNQMAALGKPLFVPAGTFYFSDTIDFSTLSTFHIEGVSRGVSRFYFNSGDSAKEYAALYYSGSDTSIQPTIKNLDIICDFSQTAGNGGGIAVEAKAIVLEFTGTGGGANSRNSPILDNVSVKRTGTRSSEDPITISAYHECLVIRGFNSPRIYNCVFQGLEPYQSNEAGTVTDHTGVESYCGARFADYIILTGQSGTVSVSGTTVTGSGTTFTGAYSAGDEINYDGNYGWIDSVDSDTQITLVDSGTTVSGVVHSTVDRQPTIDPQVEGSTVFSANFGFRAEGENEGGKFDRCKVQEVDTGYWVDHGSTLNSQPYWTITDCHANINKTAVYMANMRYAFIQNNLFYIKGTTAEDPTRFVWVNGPADGQTDGARLNHGIHVTNNLFRAVGIAGDTFGFDAKDTHWPIVTGNTFISCNRPVYLRSGVKYAQIADNQAYIHPQETDSGKLAYTDEDFFTDFGEENWLTHKYGVFSRTGTTYTFAADDQARTTNLNHGTGITATIPAEATTNFPVGAKLKAFAGGAGTATIEVAAGVTLNGITAGSADISAQYGVVTVEKVGSDAWVISGDNGAVS